MRALSEVDLSIAVCVLVLLHEIDAQLWVRLQWLCLYCWHIGLHLCCRLSFNLIANSHRLLYKLCLLGCAQSRHADLVEHLLLQLELLLLCLGLLLSLLLHEVERSLLLLLHELCLNSILAALSRILLLLLLKDLLELLVGRRVRVVSL